MGKEAEAITDTTANAAPRTAKISGKISGAEDSSAHSHSSPTAVQRAWLRRGLDQPGGKLPLFDTEGQQVCERTVRACIEKGWAEPWFSNPLKPDWIVCKLTETGRSAAS